MSPLLRKLVSRSLLFIPLLLGTLLFLGGFVTLFLEDRLLLGQWFLLLVLFVPLFSLVGVFLERRIRAGLVESGVVYGESFFGSVVSGMGKWLLASFLSVVLLFVILFFWTSMFSYGVHAEYNYDRFHRSAFMDHQQEAGPITLENDVILYTLAGEEVVLSSLWANKPAVIEFGSISCPIFTGKIKTMDELAAHYDSLIDFYVVYVREAHPGSNYPSHTNFDQKLTHAKDLQKEEGVGRVILVDSVEGTLDKMWGPHPNAVFVFGTDGEVVYESEWNNPDEVATQLDILLKNSGLGAGVEPVNEVYDMPMMSFAMIKEMYVVFMRAGFGSMSDFFLFMWDMALYGEGEE